MEIREHRAANHARRAVLRIACAGGLLAGQAALVSPARAQGLTHLGQHVGQHVTLILEEDGSRCEADIFRRVFFNGNLSLDPFEVPSGHTLVVTDVEWRVNWNGREERNNTLISVQLGISVAGNTVFVSTSAQYNSGYYGNIGGAQYLTSGFLVGPGGRICVRATQLGGLINPGFSHTTDTKRLDHLILRGYLVQNPVFDPALLGGFDLP